MDFLFYLNINSNNGYTIIKKQIIYAAERFTHNKRPIASDYTLQNKWFQV